jgi:hypothetical protein
MELHKRFEAELVQRFLKELKEDERLALGSPPKITTIFVDGRPELVDEPQGIILSPAEMILHIKAESETHWWALLLLDKTYISAAYRAGFNTLSISPLDRVCFAYQCHP